MRKLDNDRHILVLPWAMVEEVAAMAAAVLVVVVLCLLMELVGADLAVKHFVLLL